MTAVRASVVIGVAAATTACGRPTLDALVDGKHYAEALCAVYDAEGPDRARVRDALARDTRVIVRIRELSPAERAQRFAGAAPLLDEAGLRAVHVEIRSNLLPLDAFGASGWLEGAYEADVTSMLHLTHEPEPPRVSVRTIVTPGNALRLLGWIFVPYLAVNPEIRRSMALESEWTTAPADVAEYRRTAPLAMGVVDGLEGKCEPLGAAKDGDARLHAGARCDEYFLVDARAARRLSLRAFVGYSAQMLTMGSGEPKTCAIHMESELPLGDTGTLDATLARFARGPVEMPRPHVVSH